MSSKGLKGGKGVKRGKDRSIAEAEKAWVNPLCDYRLTMPFTAHGSLFMVPTSSEDGEKWWKFFSWKPAVLVAADALLSKGVKLSVECPAWFSADATSILARNLKAELCARHDEKSQRLVLWDGGATSEMETFAAEYERDD